VDEWLRHATKQHFACRRFSTLFESIRAAEDGASYAAAGRILLACDKQTCRMSQPPNSRTMTLLTLVKIVIFLSIAFAAIGVGMSAWAEGKGKY